MGGGNGRGNGDGVNYGESDSVPVSRAADVPPTAAISGLPGSFVASGSALPSSQSYAYDANSNRTGASVGNSTTSLTTGPVNQIATDGTFNYAYDADGNLITKTTIATGATENYTWDYRNRLTEVTDKNGEGATTLTIQYTYNVFNQRISQTVTNGSGTVTLAEKYVYDTSTSLGGAGSNLLMTLNGSGNVTHVFLNGPGGQTLADDAGGGNVTWMLADQQGSVRDVIDNSGTVLDHLQYDPYGNLSNSKEQF